MQLDNINTHLVNHGSGDCGFGNIFMVFGAVLCGALHITAMLAFTDVWKGIPTCCGAHDDETISQAYHISMAGIFLAVGAGAVTFFVTVASFFKEFEKKYRFPMNIVKLILNNGYAIISIVVILVQMYDIGQSSKDAAIEILVGSIVSLVMLIFAQVTKKDDEEENLTETNKKRSFYCLALSLLIILGQIIVSICYLYVPVHRNAFCWTNDSGVGDDGMQSGYAQCSSNVCLQLNVAPTNEYSNSYGTMTEYCTADCCYWKT